MEQLSHDDTLVLQAVVRIDGDLLLLPEQIAPPYEEARMLMAAGVIKPDESSIYAAAFKIIEIGMKYKQERRGDLEPAWVKDLPMSVRTHLRIDYAITEEDAFAIVPSFRHTGLSYMVTDDGLTADVCREFNVHRLQNIKQLGFLNQPIYNSYSKIRQSLSDGTRYLHSLDVSTIGTVIGRNIGLPDPMLHTLRTLCLAHDTATPAGGDSIKMVDPTGLDEDSNFHLFVERADMRMLERKYGVRTNLLLEGIHNRGLLGEILDIADKLAYIARDLSMCLHHIEKGADDGLFGLRTLLGLLARYPHVCSIWDSIAIQDEHPVFTNAARLVAFLKVRLLMFRELYYEPSTRFGEFLMSRIFVKHLYQKGLLTRERLLEMSDDQLMTMIDRTFGTGIALDACSNDLARCNAFATVSEAQAFMDRIRSDGNVFAMLDDNTRSIKTGTGLYVKGENGPLTLEEADPGSARELREMATLLPLVHVYWIEGEPRLSRVVLDMLKKEMK